VVLQDHQTDVSLPCGCNQKEDFNRRQLGHYGYMMTGTFIQRDLSYRHMQSRSQNFVPLDQRSENESSGSIHFQITMEITEFYISGFTARACAVRSLHVWYLWRMPEMDAPRALVFRPLVKGNEALGTRLRHMKLIHLQ